MRFIARLRANVDGLRSWCFLFVLLLLLTPKVQVMRGRVRRSLFISIGSDWERKKGTAYVFAFFECAAQDMDKTSAGPSLRTSNTAVLPVAHPVA